MADFRAERLFIRIAGAIDGFDPNQGIDADEFALLMVCDQGTHQRTPLADFTFAPFDKPRWFKAAKGLETLRAFIAELEPKFKQCNDDRARRLLERDLRTLRAVEDRLDTIDAHDLTFHFLARDLE